MPDIMTLLDRLDTLANLLGKMTKEFDTKKMQLCQPTIGKCATNLGDEAS